MKYHRLVATALFLSTTLIQSAGSPALASPSAESNRSHNAGQSSQEKPFFTADFVKPTMTESQLQSAVSAIDELAQKQIDDHVVPGIAISIVHNDKLIFAKGYGVKEAGKPDKIDPDTVFQIASVSKALASTVVAATVGEKIVAWDSKICDLDPSFALFEPWVTSQLTIRDLFAHRSGLPAHAGDILEDIGYDRAEILHRLRYQVPASSMRSAYAYTNFGLTEGGVAAARAAGTTWENLSETKLYKPLGMTSTSSRFSDFWSRPNKALGHVMVDGKWVHKKQRTPDPQSPAGGVSSSVNDLAKWMRLQIAGGKFEGKQVVAEAALAETHHPQMVASFSPVTGLPDFYGLGMNVSYDKRGRLVLGHSGGFAMGAATNVKMIPTEGLGICVLTNAAPIGMAEGLTSTFTDLALNGKASQDWLALFRKVFSDPHMSGVTVGHYTKPPQAPGPALESRAYIGTYENDFWGKMTVSEKDGALFVTLGKGTTAQLAHYDRDTFTFELDTEDLSGPSGLTFTMGADGKAVSALAESLDEVGQGLFKR